MSKETIEVRTHGERTVPPRAVRELYDHVGWERPGTDEGVAVVLASGPAVGAWDGEDLVGFARALSDGRFAAYIEDVMLLAEYRYLGVGERLLSLLLGEVGAVANVNLFCEPAVVPFYESGGFVPTPYVLMRHAREAR